MPRIQGIGVDLEIREIISQKFDQEEFRGVCNHGKLSISSFDPVKPILDHLFLDLRSHDYLSRPYWYFFTNYYSLSPET